MVEAGQTTVSAGGIWTIVIVMVLLLAFWLSAIALADRSQVRASGRARRAGAAGLGAARARESGPGAPAAEIPRQAARAPAGATGGGTGRGVGVPPGEAPARADLPAQRTGDADQAARSYAGPDDDQDEASRR